MRFKLDRTYYPVIERDYKGGVYEPIPDWAPDDWRNQNRLPYDPQRDIDLMMEYFTSIGYEPEPYSLILAEFDPTNETCFKNKNGETLNFVDANPDMFSTWHIGRILRLGRGCFSSDKFPLGAIASLGDYVHFDLSNARRTRFNNVPIVQLEDVNIKGHIQNPYEFINA